jgi:CheY-like chemotaxis protein
MSDVKTVLIVDDEPEAVEFVESVLSGVDGVETISASDGRGGLEKARESKPDLIILDVQMPDLTGFQVFHELRKHEDTKRISIVMLTGVAERIGFKFSAEEMDEYMGTAPQAYLEKPVAPADLETTVRGILDLPGA